MAGTRLAMTVGTQRTEALAPDHGDMGFQRRRSRDQEGSETMNERANATALSLRLPLAGGGLETFKLSAPRDFPARASGPMNRIAFSAAHVVADPLAASDPWLEAAIDWDRTIAYRQRLWDLGLGVAEAMDTAQRGMGLDWPTSLDLIRRSVEAAKAYGPEALVFFRRGH